MDINHLATKIKHLQSETTRQIDATPDEGNRREMQGYLRGLEQVTDLIKQAKDVARLEQQLARKRSLLEQDPDPEWSHLASVDLASTAGKETVAANVSKMPAQAHANSHEKASGEAQIAA